MKTLLSFISIMFISFSAYARPKHLVGTWVQSGQVELLSLKDHRVSQSAAETHELRKMGYTCRNLTSRTLCEKWLPPPGSLQQNVAHFLRQQAPKSVTLQQAQEIYHIIHESMAYSEWGKRQTSFVDQMDFNRLHWREVTDSPPRIILKRDQDSQQVEFLLTKDGSITKLVTGQAGAPNHWRSFSALIHYTIKQRR